MQLNLIRNSLSVQSQIMKLWANVLPVHFQPVSLLMNCLSSQLSLGNILMDFLYYLVVLFCSALVGSCSVCSALVGSCAVFPSLVGFCSVYSAVEVFCSVCSVVMILSSIDTARSVLVSCSAGFAYVPCFFTCTWTCPSPCSASAPPPSCIGPSWEHLEAAPWGGGCSVMNLVSVLPSCLLQTCLLML